MEGMAKAAFAALVLLLLINNAASDSLPAYTNHTVGEAAGWLFIDATEMPSTNFSLWASNQTFYLGDFLIFNTNTNHTVLQTYNETTYAACSADDDYGNETTMYTAGTGVGVPVTIAVPLTIEGKLFYFSDANDGNECEKGMRFAIEVEHGRGLPPSLNQPPPPPYEEPPPSPDKSETSPATTTSSQRESFYRGGSEKAVAGGDAATWILLFSCLGFFLLH